MNAVIKLEDKRQEFKTAASGSEPPKDWLRLLPKGTIFLSRELKDKSSYVFDQFTILRISAKGIYLKGYLGISKEETPSHLWVNSEAFSESNEFIEVLREEKKEKT